jgi:hypothetical protein
MRARHWEGWLGPVAGVLAFRRPNDRQEVRPMNAVSAVGAPSQSMIARLR